MSSFDRRRFLKVLGVTGGGAAAMSGCGPDTSEKLIPYLIAPDNQLPGIATTYATTCRECSAGCGMHVRVREGRAVKAEGNPGSPVNHGRLCARGQASLQGLYNPDRIRQPLVRSGDGFEPISWDDALARVAEEIAGREGSSVWFLTGAEAGAFDQLVNAWLAALGSDGRTSYEPFAYEALRFANRQVFGIDAVPDYRFADAGYVISFGADFLETFVSPVQYAGGFAQGHGFHDGHMGRFVHVEPRMSMTGMSADEWIAPNPGTEGLLALAMARVVLDEHGERAPQDVARIRGVLEQADPDAVAEEVGIPAETIRRLAREFAEGPSVAVAGGVGSQHDAAHVTAAAVNLLNYVAGNVGRTVRFDSARTVGGGYGELQRLTDAMSAGGVGVLFVHGANPVFNTPATGGFASALAQVGFTVSFARFMDETAAMADLILPDHDPLEQWNDYEPQPGTRLLQQPVMQAVFDTRQTGDVLLQIAQQVAGTLGAAFSAGTFKEYLQQAWQGVQRRSGDGQDFESFWRQALQRGGVYGDPPARQVSLAPGAAEVAPGSWSGAGGDMTFIAYPSPVFHDGRAANRPWLQELPDPVSKVTWGSWVEIHPETAAEHGIAEGDFVEIASETGTVTAPAFLYPGIRRDTVAMPIGQGHIDFGRYATERGANPYALLSGEVTGFGGLSHYAPVRVSNTGVHERLATNAGRSRQMGRGIAQSTTLETIEEGHFHTFHIEHAAEVPEHIEPVLEEWQHAQDEATKYGNYAGEHPRWGLAIDLSRCTGCSACVTACYAENNIPIVGKEAVQRGREMSWLRIERYFEGGENGEPLQVELLPMMCQQCGRAPCEPVCPVFAAYHTPDGLNGQVYNRCVGTRYCGNNCPYKVRYFNWFDHGNPNDAVYSWPDPLHMALNPDVTVRSKGVMEKCTFCVQRIRGAQNQARIEGRTLDDGEIAVACEQTCPTDAIVFGDLNDPESRVSQARANELGYHVLDGLNTDPGVTYLTRVRNTVEA